MVFIFSVNRSINPSPAFGSSNCSQVLSCAEATYFLKSCPGTKMDGDNDSVPCEDQLCR
ncbi:excalibur calcium-binding domain-containing protein [Polaromonas sp.]|uniref:excalibur calcium-binding domain-containing protein n=1 Tax=Polaromonas sp. TaxID=1869339 RepID=UPI00351E8F85